MKKNFMTPKIRNKVPETIKMSSSLESFKSKIRKLQPHEHVAFIIKICNMLVPVLRKEPMSSSHQVVIRLCCIISVNFRGVFTTESNIYDGAFLQK